MKARFISDALHDAIHILSAAHKPLTREERLALETLADGCGKIANVFVAVRGGRRLHPPEVMALVRVASAAFAGAGIDGEGEGPLKDTPPGGFRRS